MFPKTAESGVKEENHEYNGHGNHNMNKACPYKEDCSAWVDRRVAGL